MFSTRASAWPKVPCDNTENTTKVSQLDIATMVFTEFYPEFRNLVLQNPALFGDAVQVLSTAKYNFQGQEGLWVEPIENLNLYTFFDYTFSPFAGAADKYSLRVQICVRKPCGANNNIEDFVFSVGPNQFGADDIFDGSGDHSGDHQHTTIVEQQRPRNIVNFCDKVLKQIYHECLHRKRTSTPTDEIRKQLGNNIKRQRKRDYELIRDYELKDCKKCRFCLDNPVYGGRGTKKQRCEEKTKALNILRNNMFQVGDETTIDAPGKPLHGTFVLVKEVLGDQKYLVVLSNQSGKTMKVSQARLKQRSFAEC